MNRFEFILAVKADLLENDGEDQIKKRDDTMAALINGRPSQNLLACKATLQHRMAKILTVSKSSMQGQYGVVQT
jgi:hypothetical protein